ncbi:hypothetical protein T439DRAFT_200308 [Meredithblackwellia eburnea MCA 4105]
MPNLASPSFTTPRFPGGFNFTPAHGSPGGASAQWSPPREVQQEAGEELARFFREREDRGNPPMTAFEQAAVAELSKRIGGGAGSYGYPTAFTPNFKASSPFYSSQANGAALPTSVSLNSIFSTSAGSDAASNSSTPFRRRRPLYVGAGYSSQSARRRKQGSAIFGYVDGIKKSNSEGSLNGPGAADATESVAEGKRRKVDDPESSNSSSSGLLGSDSSSSAAPAPSTSSTSTSKAPIIKPRPSISATPAKPSPLWQVSKADTPSPSPPKKPVPAKPPTRAADLMLDIIRQEDEAQPKVTREAVLNPYATDDSPIARVPRSRPPRVSTPRSTRSSSRAAASKSSTPAKKISPLEELERSMPAEYRPESKRQRKAISPSPEPASAPTPNKKASKPVEKPAPAKTTDVIELSDSDDEDSPPPPVKAPKKSKKTEPLSSQTALAPTPFKFPSAAAPSASGPFGALSPATGAFGTVPATGGSFAPAPSASTTAPFAVSSVGSTPAFGTSTPAFGTAPPLMPSPRPSIPADPSPFNASSPNSSPVQATAPQFRASVPPTPPPAFGFSSVPASPVLDPPTDPRTTNGTVKEMSTSEARREAKWASRAILPPFSFAGALDGVVDEESGSDDNDPVLKSVRDVVREMERKELPVLAL